MKMRKMFSLLLCAMLIISLLLPVNSFAGEAELLTGENEAAVKSVSSIEELFAYYPPACNEGTKTVTVTIPEGDAVAVTGQLSLSQTTMPGYDTFVLTGGGTLFLDKEDLSVYMLYAGTIDLVLENIILDGQNHNINSRVILLQYGASILMKGGKIRNFTTSKKATGGQLKPVVNVTGSCSFVMDGGSIENTSMDAVIAVDGGDCTINSGTIQNNQSVYGTVGLWSKAGFTMNGGSIVNNTSQYGGAVYSGVSKSRENKVTLLGGTISGNHAVKQGDGIYFAYGNPVVLGAGCNLYDTVYFETTAVEEDAYLLLTDALNYPVNVAYYDSPSFLHEGRVVAKGTGGYGITEADVSHINCANDGFAPAFLAGGTPQENTAVLEQSKYTITYDVNGQTSSEVLPYNARPSYSGQTSRAADGEYVYTFAGWTDLQGVFYDSQLALVTENMQYTAVYDRISLRDNFLKSVERIGTAPLTYSELTGNQLVAADAAWQILSNEAKAEEEIAAAYRTLVSCHRAWEVLKKIDVLPGEITLLQRTVIQEARSAYNALTASEKAMIPDNENFGASYRKLTAAEETYGKLARIQTLHTSKSTYTVYVNGSAVNLGAWTDGDGSPVYKSLSPQVVSVDAKGNLKALQGGTAKITVQVPASSKFDASNVITVTVTAKKATQTIKSYAKYSGRNFKMTSTTTGNGKITYQSLNPKVAKVDSSGNVKTVGVGTVVIRVTAQETPQYEKASRDYTFDIVAAYGASYTVGGIKYKVTNANSGGDGTVRVEGLSKSTSKVTIGSTVKIGNHSYRITAIKASAFKNQKKMTSVTIGSNVTTIGAQAFYGCKKLSKITVKSTKLKKVGSNALKGIKSSAVIKVPKSKLSAYKKLFKGKGQGKKVTIKK